MRKELGKKAITNFITQLRKFALSKKLCYCNGNNLLIVLQQKSGAFPALFCCYAYSNFLTDTIRYVPQISPFPGGISVFILVAMEAIPTNRIKIGIKSRF